jgi:hypothetical protein
VTAGLKKALRHERPGEAAALEKFIDWKRDSISQKTGQYLLELEAEALRVLGQVLEERLAAIEAARKAFLDGQGVNVVLRKDGDGGALPARTQSLLEELKAIKRDRDDVRRIEEENAPSDLADVALRLATSAMTTIVDPGPGADVDAGGLLLLKLVSPLLDGAQAIEDALRHATRQRHQLLSSARALLAQRVKTLIEREPTAVVLVTPASDEVPIDDLDVAKRLDARLATLADRLKQLRARLQAGELSAFHAQVSDIGIAMSEIRFALPPGFSAVMTGAEFVGLGKPHSMPERALARLLLTPILPLTVWRFSPVVKSADLNLRTRGPTDELASAIFPSLQQELVRGALDRVIEDVAFSIFMMGAAALSGPAAPLLMAFTLLLDLIDAAETTAKYVEERQIAEADVDVVGNVATVRVLLDRAPDLAQLIVAWLGVLGGSASAGAAAVKTSAALQRSAAAATAVPLLSALSARIAQAGLLVAVVSIVDELVAEPAPDGS